MNDKFFSLPEEKQQSIINAAMEVFACYDYKHASTDLIASKAGISKGLLFYYFHNKKELYLFLYSYIKEMLMKEVVDQKYLEITDFFELLEYSALKKAKIMRKNPYILDFSVHTFYSEKEAVSDALADMNFWQQDDLFDQFCGHIDREKFKDAAEPHTVFKMLVWMTDGYLHELRMMQKPLDVNALMQEFYRWCSMLKQLVYKEEYIL